MAYLLDANIFIQAKKLHYGFDFCPAFWEWLDARNADGTVFSIEKVRDELVAGNDDLSTWAAARGASFFVPPDNTTTPSLAAVSSWAGSGNYEPAAVSTFLQSGADYYLVAQALALSHVVVTHEIPSTSTRRIKIPDACLGVGVKVMSPYEMLRSERARFVLGP
ncbi:MAG TPA: DUF4411 family protein [Acidimicrobiales bacterium]|nr:DUF4411 family protein [Acidimicrobiales bacterium]